MADNNITQKMEGNPFSIAMSMTDNLQMSWDEGLVSLSQRDQYLQQLEGSLAALTQGYDGNTGGLKLWEKIAIGVGIAAIGTAVSIFAPELIAGAGALFAAGEAAVDAGAVGTELLVAGGEVAAETGSEALAVGSEALAEGSDALLDGGFEISSDLTEDMTGEMGYEMSDLSSMTDDTDLVGGSDRSGFKERFQTRLDGLSDTVGGTDKKSRVLRGIKGGALSTTAGIAIASAAGKYDSTKKTNDFNKDMSSSNSKENMLNGSLSSLQALISNLQTEISGLGSSIFTQALQAALKVMNVSPTA